MMKHNMFSHDQTACEESQRFTANGFWEIKTKRINPLTKFAIFICAAMKQENGYLKTFGESSFIGGNLTNYDFSETEILISAPQLACSRRHHSH